MNDGNPKLYYLASQFKVKIEVTKDICISNPKVIENLINRATQKLESVKAKGEIDFFVIYKEKIINTWKQLISSENIPGHKVIDFTLGVGGVNLKGVEIKFNKESIDNFIVLNITTDPTVLKNWPPHWFKAYIDFQMYKEFKHFYRYNGAQLQAAILKARNNQPISDLPIAMLQNNLPYSEIKEKPYSIIANQQRKELAVLIRSFPDTLKKTTLKQLILNVEKACKILQEKTGDNYSTLQNGITKTFEKFEHSQRMINVDIPETILAAISLGQTSANTRNDQFLKLKVAKDKMKASIENFDMSLYEKINPPIDIIWFERQLEKLSITKNAYELHLKDAEVLLKNKENLTGLIIAEGTPPRPKEKPFLHETYMETNKPTIKEDNISEVINIREMHQRYTVKTGELIAEIRYSIEGQDGQDIFGAPIPTTPLEELKIKIGDGVKFTENKFYAIIDGSPSIDKEKGISVKSKLVLNEDVNLRTGNINFDGPIDINGTVDYGATVYASGEITINGSVRGTVISKANITVNGGIVTGAKSRVESRGSIKADFIENSNIHCEGDLIVKKALVNSRVISGGNIIITDEHDGILAGGEVSCLRDISSKNIGFQRGARTTLNVGVDWKLVRYLTINKGRLEKLTNYNTEVRKDLRELVSKKPNHTSKKQSDMKEILQHRLTKSRLIIEKIELKIATLTSKIAYNMKSKVCVNGILCTNVDINIGASRVTLQNDLAGVAIIAKKRRGSHIIQIEDVTNGLEDAS